MATELVTSCVGTVFWNTLFKESKGRIEVRGRPGRRPKQLPDYPKEKEDTGN
jgi:hypothetical protein